MSMTNNNSLKTPVPAGGIEKPVLVALGALLVGHMFSSKHDDINQAQTIKSPLQAQDNAALSDGLIGGVLAGLGGLLANSMTGAASVPSHVDVNHGGALTGGLGDLLDQLTRAGHGNKVDSWIGQGDNAAIQPDELGNAIGQKTLNVIAQHAGMNEQDLLVQLSQLLPGIIDKLTADGKVPDIYQILQLLQNQPKE